MTLSHPRLIRLIALMTALLLALPLGIGLVTLTPEDIQRQFNRAPTALPSLGQLASDPPVAVQQTVAHFADHMAGVPLMTQTLQRFRFEVLQDPTSPMIARRDDLVFLASFGAVQPPMTNLRDTCRSAVPDAAWLETLIDNTRVVFDHLATPTRKVGFLIVPSKPVLYHDRLPRGTPTSFRALCAHSAANTDLGRWEGTAKAAGIPATYPLDILTKRRDDPAYYPAANFHAEGASAHDAVRALITQMYHAHSSWPEVRMQNVRAPADLEFVLTFPRDSDMYLPDYGAHTAPFDDAATQALRASDPAMRHAHVWRASDPIIGGQAVIIGNSFAKHAAPNVAPYFDQTIMFGMAAASDPELTTALQKLTDQADAVIFLVQDTAAKHWLWQRERERLDAMTP